MPAADSYRILCTLALFGSMRFASRQSGQAGSHFRGGGSVLCEDERKDFEHLRKREGKGCLVCLFGKNSRLGGKGNPSCDAGDISAFCTGLSGKIKII